ncbi:unnamed protein product [Jaminaea pallidilutea]
MSPQTGPSERQGRRLSTRLARASQADEHHSPTPGTSDVAGKRPSQSDPDNSDGLQKRNKLSSSASKDTKKAAAEEHIEEKQACRLATLKVGQSLPRDLQLEDETGSDVAIADLKKVVFFLYPKANTGGCTKQACEYRDDYVRWTEAGFSVFGLSADNVQPLANWKRKYDFPYRLLSDPQRLLIRRLTGTASKTIRSHFVIDGHGKIADAAIPVKAADSSRLALTAAQKLL